MDMPRSRGAVTGLLLLALGVAAALLPLVGPDLDLVIGSRRASWLSEDRLLLSVLPGAAVALGGLLLLLAANRPLAMLGGLLALAGGVWLVVGPGVSRLWAEGSGLLGAAGRPAGSRDQQTWEVLAYFHGTGAVITALAGIALGRLAGRAAPAPPPDAARENERPPARGREPGRPRAAAAPGARSRTRVAPGEATREGARAGGDEHERPTEERGAVGAAAARRDRDEAPPEEPATRDATPTPRDEPRPAREETPTPPAAPTATRDASPTPRDEPRPPRDAPDAGRGTPPGEDPAPPPASAPDRSPPSAERPADASTPARESAPTVPARGRRRSGGLVGRLRDRLG